MGDRTWCLPPKRQVWAPVGNDRRLPLVRISVAILVLRGDRVQESVGNDCEEQNHNDIWYSGHEQSQSVRAEICSEYGWGGEGPFLSPCSLVCVGVICVLASCTWLMCHCSCCVCHYLMWKYGVEWILDTFYFCDTLLSIQDYCDTGRAWLGHWDNPGLSTRK